MKRWYIILLILVALIIIAFVLRIPGNFAGPEDPLRDVELSEQDEITEADNNKGFIYSQTTRFTLILDGNQHPLTWLTVRCVPDGILSDISEVPSVDPPKYARRFEATATGTCQIANQDFVATIDIVPE